MISTPVPVSSTGRALPFLFVSAVFDPEQRPIEGISAMGDAMGWRMLSHVSSSMGSQPLKIPWGT
jgi:hypothetical protein